MALFEKNSSILIYKILSQGIQRKSKSKKVFSLYFSVSIVCQILKLIFVIESDKLIYIHYIFYVNPITRS